MILDIASAPATPEDQARHYGAVRARLMGKFVRDVIPVPVPVTVTPEAAKAPAAPDPLLAVLEGPQWSTPRVVELRPAFGVLRRILDAVSYEREVSVADMQSKSRLQVLVQARHDFFFRAYRDTNASLPQIARACGGRDHTTALWGIAKHCARHGLPVPRNSNWFVFGPTGPKRLSRRNHGHAINAV